MPDTLPRLRMDLDFMPSPVPERPGLLIRDPFHYSDATLIVPPVLVECLALFDGEQTTLDLRAALVRLTGELNVGEVEQHLRGALSDAGFCEDESYRQMRDRQHAAFAQAERREPAYAGSAYPAEPDVLQETITGYLADAHPKAELAGLAGIAAPHVSPEGGSPCYAAAYRALGSLYKDRTFVILGTSHYGEPDVFGLTRKSFVTPLGVAVTDTGLVDELATAGGPAVRMEDYAHAVEHSIEFQIVFLQHVYGPGISVVPILCGPFSRCSQEGCRPAEDPAIARFLEALTTVAVRERERLFWVLGIDMAHMGRRYGDPFSARAGADRMQDVMSRDRERIRLVEDGDAEALWSAAECRTDALKWCGTTPLYTFLHAVPGARGELLRYQQWNIDEQSVVSFGALALRAG